MSLTTFEIYITSFLEAMIECHLHSFVCFNFLTASCKWDLSSRAGIEPLILVLHHWKCRVLTTELPGKSCYLHSFSYFSSNSNNYKQAALISERVVIVNKEKQTGLRSKSDSPLNKERSVRYWVYSLYTPSIAPRDLYYQEETMISLYSGSGVKSSQM